MLICVSIAESLKSFVDKLRSTSNGRMINTLRLPYRVAAMATMGKGGLCCAGLERRAEWLGLSVRLCQQERARYEH